MRWKRGSVLGLIYRPLLGLDLACGRSIEASSEFGEADEWFNLALHFRTFPSDFCERFGSTDLGRVRSH